MIEMLPKLDEVKSRRKALGISQKKLAGLAGVSRSLIAKLETNSLNPTYAVAQRLFNALERAEAERMGKVALRTINVGQIHAAPVEFAEASDTVQKVWERMVETSFSQFGVRDGNRIVGSVTEQNINRALMEQDLKEVRSLPVREIMDGPFPTVGVEMPVAAVVPLLEHAQAVLTVDEENVTGIVTNSDVGRIFRVIARAKPEEKMGGTSYK